MLFALLCLSIVLSTGRNLLSKSLSELQFGTRAFFLCQGVLFLGGSMALVLFGKVIRCAIALPTLCYAILYAILLIFAQWFYTAALAKGNTAICSTVYSLGFIFPALSGAILWKEPFSVLSALGILCAVAAVVLSGSKLRSHTTDKNTSYFFPLITAMLASGGLGIIQKLQQTSAFADQKSVFLLIAFLFAAVISLFGAVASKNPGSVLLSHQKLVLGGSIGICFGCCNLLNTTLAGKLDSAIFFPILNIGVILLTFALGVSFFKEKISKKEITVLILSLLSILLLNSA